MVIRLALRARFVAALALSFGLAAVAIGQQPPAAGSAPAAADAPSGDDKAEAAKPAAAPSAPTPQPKPYEAVLKDFKPVAGMIPLYHKDIRLIGEISDANLNKDLIVIISIAKGISQKPLLGGMSWGSGDDWIWQFRKADDRILVVRRNVRFRADDKSPEASAVEMAYTDSVLFALPIMTKGPGGGDLVDLTQVFMSDLPQIGDVLRGFAFNPQKSVWHEVKGFKDNVELQVAATYQGKGDLDTVPDSRGTTIHVHYSISKLPSTGYVPRLADDRVGYFLTAVKDFSKGGDDEQFIRYINRWDLQKADPKAKISLPKKQIVFHIEKTMPLVYRKPIRDGIAEWNKAFEKAGFYDAVRVEYQPDDATWDPEDINYNTFRWITAQAAMAMGPSRVNPLTGQILDADIIFDADFVRFWKTELENFTPKSIEQICGGPVDMRLLRQHNDNSPFGPLDTCANPACTFAHGMSHELAFGAAALMERANTPEEVEKLIMQGLKEVTMHEVGHTLGLRHNFKSSTMLSLEDINNPEKTKETGLGGSVMDYMPANLQPKGSPQGDYYSQTIGPYDMWAIEYGYTPIGGGSPEKELPKLKEIASRSGEPQLSYLTDEDTNAVDPDPLSNRFDLGNDTVAYAKLRAKLISDLWPGLVERVVEDGDGYQRARQTFNVLLAQYGRAMDFASRYVGGVYVSRSHRGDKDAKPPFVVVDAAKQREALALIEENVLSDKPFGFTPELYNQLNISRWYHWGTDANIRTDYPVHETILMWQERSLARLLSPLTLERLHDSELKVPADQDAFTTAELIQRLTKAVFSETDELQKGEFTNRKPAISSMRRNLQRSYLQRLTALALGNSSAPQDCQTIAYSELGSLAKRIDVVLTGRPELKLDAYTRAHLEETAARIRKVLDARVEMKAG
ncbi:MAG: zinc-dependent metalloprotease [Pirellulales bacterium]